MAKSTDELIYDIQNELVDPTTNRITGERVKARLLDMVETMAESAGSGGGQLKYYRIEPDSDALELMYAMGSLLKAHPTENASQVSIRTPVMFGTPMSLFTIVAAAVDLSLRIVAQGMNMTVGQYFDMVLEMEGIGSLEEVGAHEITEDAFYTI